MATSVKPTLLRDMALVKYIRTHGGIWINKQELASTVLPVLNAMLPKEAQSQEFADWSRRINLDRWFFRPVAPATFVITGDDYVPKIADGEASEIISTLKKILKEDKHWSKDRIKVKDWETRRGRMGNVSSSEVREKLHELAPTMSDLNTDDDYGMGREGQLCHIVGSKVLNSDSETQTLRHGDVFFGDANKNQVESYFGAKGFGDCYLYEVKNKGLYLKIPDDASKNFKRRWDGVLLVPADRSVTVKDKDGDEVPLYDLLTNAVRVQMLVIEYRHEIARRLHEKHTKKKSLVLQIAAGAR